MEWTTPTMTSYCVVKSLLSNCSQTKERLANLARHAPLNARVNYAVGSSPTGSIMKQFQSVKYCIYPVSLLV